VAGEKYVKWVLLAIGMGSIVGRERGIPKLRGESKLSKKRQYPEPEGTRSKVTLAISSGRSGRGFTV